VAAAIVANLAFGALHIPVGSSLSIAIRIAARRSVSGFPPEQVATIQAIRFPRAVLSVLVGAALALAGAALQGIFRNPLADPALIGVSSGAAVGAVAGIVYGVTFLGRYSLSFMAFTGALMTTFLVYRSARRDGRTEIVTLLLTGIAVNALAASAIGYFIFRANDQQLRGITFWQLGSMGGATWDLIAATTPFIAVGGVVIFRHAHQLNLLALGEREAAHLGIDTERVRATIIFISALLVGASVAAVGSVAFVGLVVPHLVRLLVGPDHRIVLPASALGGALLLTCADLAARNVAVPQELPLGVVTASIGGVFFFYLLRRVRRSQGGWA
jgi:iron complex transport system permease protein